MNSKEKEYTPAEIANVKFDCRIMGVHCCVRCLCGPSAFFGEVERHPETSEVWTTACSVRQRPKLVVLSVRMTHHLFPSVSLAASACTRHDF